MKAILELPFPHLSEGRFASVHAYTDEGLFATHGIRIAFTERTGGVSEGPYYSLNIGRVSDEPKRIAENQKILLNAFRLEYETCLRPSQVHGDEVYVVETQADYEEVQSRIEKGVDALIIEPARVAALLGFADCVPVILVSPSGTFAVVHAGWRGVVAGIVPKAFLKLRESDRGKGFAFSSHDYNVYIGPYIHAECFEVGEEVRLAFSETFGPDCLVDDSHVDLGKALRLSLEEEGVEPSRIGDIDICTVCENDRFYSHRAQDGVCGRHGVFAIRREL